MNSYMTFSKILLLCYFLAACQHKTSANKIETGSVQNCKEQPTLNDSETLCGESNITRLECHRDRIPECGDNNSWMSLCLFSLPMNKTAILNDFLEHFLTNYSCVVKGDFGNVHCQRKSPPNYGFTSRCNFTFYKCFGNVDHCLENTSREFEEGGRCPPPEKECPSQLLFSLTNLFHCKPFEKTLQPINYTDLQRLDIRPPRRCTVNPTVIAGVILAVVFLISILISSCYVFHKCKKIDKKISAEVQKDPILKFTNTIFDEFKDFVQTYKEDKIEEVIHTFDYIYVNSNEREYDPNPVRNNEPCNSVSSEEQPVENTNIPVQKQPYTENETSLSNQSTTELTEILPKTSNEYIERNNDSDTVKNIYSNDSVESTADTSEDKLINEKMTTSSSFSVPIYMKEADFGEDY